VTAESATGRSRATLLLPVFFLSGFSALVYQTIWQRVLTLFSGADALAVTLIVAAFMAGLGCGSLAGARWADHLSLRRRFLVFALAELAVGIFAWLSLPLYYDVLYLHLGTRTLPQGLIGLLLFVTLLWPTFFMGLSLPLLARTIGPTGKTPEDWVGQLYGFNTLGAAVGALVSVWYLARRFGFETSLHVAAVLNLVCALVALALARGVPEQAGAAPQVPSSPGPLAAVRPATFGFSTWTLLFALSGFIALSLEILWFRVLGVILKSNAFTFATLLSIYLVGVGGGALWGSRWARRSERPAEIFLLLQALIPAYAALALAGFLHGVAGWPELYAYLGGYETLDLKLALPALAQVLSWSTLDQDARALVRLFGLLYGFVPLVLFGPPTLLMGLSFPFLQKATQTDPRVLGRRVGMLQAANILGCTLGSIVTGLWLLGQLGTAGSLRLLVGLGALFLLLFAVIAHDASRRTRMLTLAGIAPLVLAALVLSPTTRSLWATLHGAGPADVITGEDGSGLSVLRDMLEGDLPVTVVFAGGLGQSGLPYGGEHTLLGTFPVLLHPEPRDVAIVGLGSGDTLFGAAARSATTQLDCIEIVRPQLESLRVLDRTHAYAGLSLLLSDPRMHFLTGDGREFLMRTTRRYDVIEADALRPTSAFSGSIYSREYFSLLRTRLKPGGLAVSWAPTTRVRDTFRHAFPHVLELNQVLIGSESPIAFDAAAVRAQLDEPFTRAHFARGQVDMKSLMGKFLEGEPTFYGPLAAGAGPTDLNTDLYPRDEYLVPRLGPRRR
jgi:spermidine synthase